MRKFLVIAVLAGLAWVFVVQKRNETTKPAQTAAPKVVTTSLKPGAPPPATTAASPRPVNEHNWMKNSLDRANEVKRQVVQQRKADGTR